LREVELLVEAGFTPVEAIKIASSNGAKFLSRSPTVKEGTVVVTRARQEPLLTRGLLLGQTG
jgi:imidazolonepropionase-like amidohydrolase